MMDSFSTIGYIAGIFGLVSVITAAFIIAKGTTAKTTIDQQKELIGVLTAAKLEQQNQISTLTTQHIESMKAISNLQGQIDVLKSIPLVSIDTNLKDIVKFNETLTESNTKILLSLQKSAILLSDEKHKGGLLVKTVQTQPLDVKPQ